MVSFDLNEDPVLSASVSEELDMGMRVGASAEQLSQCTLFDELLEVVRRALAKFNLDWPNEQEMFLTSS